MEKNFYNYSIKKKFNKVIIVENNQQIVDKCNWIFLSITPTVGQKIVKELNFRANQIIISFISTINLSELKELKSKEEIVAKILDKALQYYNKKEEIIPEELLRKLEKFVVLRTIDEKWRNHLLGMDQLREGIGLRAFGQKNPLIEYKAEAYNFFQDLMVSLRASIVQRVYHAQISENPRPKENAPLQKNIQLTHADASADTKSQPVSTPENNMEEKIGRNDKIKVLSPTGDEVEIKFKKLEYNFKNLNGALILDFKKNLHFEFFINQIVRRFDEFRKVLSPSDYQKDINQFGELTDRQIINYQIWGDPYLFQDSKYYISFATFDDTQKNNEMYLTKRPFSG